jgi:hypothetical protein
VGDPSLLVIGDGPPSVCGKCHEKDDKPKVMARKLAHALKGAQGVVAASQANAARARQLGLRAPEIAAALEDLRAAELRLRPLVHTLDPERVETAVAGLEKLADKADALVAEGKATRRSERRGYYGALALSLLFFAALVLKAREIERTRAS